MCDSNKAVFLIRTVSFLKSDLENNLDPDYSSEYDDFTVLNGYKMLEEFLQLKGLKLQNFVYSGDSDYPW